MGEIAIKESDLSANICVIVTTGEMIITASLTISTRGFSATGAWYISSHKPPVHFYFILQLGKTLLAYLKKS